MKTTSFLMTILVIIFSFIPGRVLAAEISLPIGQPAFLPGKDEPAPEEEQDSEPLLPPVKGEISISEIVSNSLAGGEEWVEIRITADMQRNGGGLTLSDAAGVIYTFAADTVLYPDEFLVLSGWGNKLNNSGDSITIQDASGSVIAETLDFPALDKCESWAYDGIGYRKSTILTPGAENEFEETGNAETEPPEQTESPIAGPGELVISEIMSDPSEGEEWIELVLNAEEPRSLAGIAISDNVGIMFRFEAEDSIAPDEFLVLSGWGNKLNNSGDSVIIHNAAGSPIAEVLDFPSTGKDHTWLPQEDALGVPTPGEVNIRHEETTETPDETETGFPVPISGEVMISEIYSNPVDDEAEWIELLSVAEETLSLRQCSVTDNVGKIYEFPADTVIESGEYLVISGWGEKLNNTGDLVRLECPAETLIDEAEVPALDKGESWLPALGKKGEPTPGAENRELENQESFPETETGEEGTSDFPLPTGDEIRINEVVSNPDTGESEWVELVSLAAETRHLGGLVIADETGDIYQVRGGTEIPPSGYVVISGWGNKLNNTGDSVYLNLSDGSRLDKLTNFPALKKGESYARFPDGDKKTSMPTPGSENIFRDPVEHPAKGGSSSTNTQTPIVRTAATRPSVRADRFEIVISEVMFHGNEDFIELECRKCDIDLAGIRIADDDAFFEFPADTYVASGERVVIRFGKDGFEPYFEENSWYFPAGKSGLTGTDETVFVLDSLNNVEDAVCIANRNGEFSPGEKDDVFRLIRERKLQGLHPFSEAICFDSRLLGREMSLSLGSNKTGAAYSDYFATRETTPGKENIKAPKKSEETDIAIIDAWPVTAEILSVEVVNNSFKIVSTKGFSIETDPENKMSIEKALLPGESAYFLLANTEEAEVVTLTDAWGTMESQQQIVDKDLTIGSTALRISEVLANPEGADSGNEFLELSCEIEKCESERFLLQIGKRIVPIPETVAADELVIIKGEPLRNTDLELKIIDLESHIYNMVYIQKAKSGSSFAVYGDTLQETAYPTPGRPNVIASEDKSADSDGDGIPDFAELIVGSDPLKADVKNSTANKLFMSYFGKSTSVTIEAGEGVIEIRGKTLPHSELRIVLHSERHVVAAKSDENGHFTARAFADLKKGSHRVDLIATLSGGEVYVFTDRGRFRIDRDLRDGWIDTVEIIGVLPNPAGKDTNREMVILKNTGEHGGWLKRASLQFGDKDVTVPDMYFHAGQRKVLAGKNVPVLRNSAGELRLVNIEGDTLSQTDWHRAKNGRWYGSEMPVPPERTKASKQKSGKKRAPYVPPATAMTDRIEREGFFWNISEDTIEIRSPEGDIVAYPLGENFSTETLDLLLQPGVSLSLIISGGEVIEIKTHHYNVSDSRSSRQVTILPILLLLLAAFVIFGSTLAVRSKQLPVPVEA